MRKLIVCAAASALILWASAAWARDKLVFVAAATNYGGFTAGTIEKLGEALMGPIGSKLGLSVELKMLPDSAAIAEAVKKGEADVVILGLDFVEARRAGIPVEPLAVISIKGKSSFNYCFYVKKENKDWTLDHIKGKSYLVKQDNYMHLRSFLWENGFEDDLDDFGEAGYFLDGASALDAILADRAVAAFMGENFMAFMGYVDKFRGKFVPTACAGPFTPSTILYRAGLDAGLVEQLSMIIQNAHRDPDFRDVRFIFLAMNGELSLVSRDDYANMFAVYERADEYGWFDDYQKAQKVKLIDNN